VFHDKQLSARSESNWAVLLCNMFRTMRSDIQISIVYVTGVFFSSALLWLLLTGICASAANAVYKSMDTYRNASSV
jgi:hypothetical protein